MLHFCWEKMLFRLIHFMFLFQDCTSLLPSLKQKKVLEKMISKSNATILIVNSDIQIELPCMYFSTNLHIPHVANQICDTGEVYIILNSAEEKEFEEVKKIVRYCLAESYFLIMAKPSKSILHYLKKNGIYKIVFVESQTQISEFNGWPTSDRIFKVCYTDHVPYTTIDHLHLNGLESLIVKHLDNFANIPVKFIKHTEPCVSGDYMGVFENLKNRSCDVVIGENICIETAPFLAFSANHMEDGTVLISPNEKCSRQFFNVPIVVACLWVFIILIGVEISRTKLKINCEKFSIKVFVTAPLLLLTVVLLGYFQAEFYDLLVTNKHNCGVKNIEDIVKNKVITGVEEQAKDFLDHFGALHVNVNTLKKYLTIDSTIDSKIQLESDKPHLTKTFLYKYLVLRYYLKENGDMKFRIVQTIHRLTYSLLIRRGYPYMNDLNLGIIKFQESGIIQYLEKQLVGYMDLNYLIKHSTLLSYFTPVNLQEFYWLFIFVLIMWVISVLVLLLEISVPKWKTFII